MTTIVSDSCETCKWWIQTTNNPITKEGYCIRYAPRPQVYTGQPQQRPITKQYEYCGDFTKR